MSVMRKLTTDQIGRPSSEDVRRLPKIPVVVVLDNVRSLNNVGSFFRTCDAFGVERLVLCGITGTPPDREIHKTALGAEETVRWEHYASSRQAIAALISEHYVPVAVEQVAGAVDPRDFRVVEGEKYALIFGNEVEGVSQQIVDMCRHAVEIPQIGAKHSLNVAVSGGVVLWSFFCALKI